MARVIRWVTFWLGAPPEKGALPVLYCAAAEGLEGARAGREDALLDAASQPDFCSVLRLLARRLLVRGRDTPPAQYGFLLLLSAAAGRADEPGMFGACALACFSPPQYSFSCF